MRSSASDSFASYGVLRLFDSFNTYGRLFFIDSFPVNGTLKSMRLVLWCSVPSVSSTRSLPSVRSVPFDSFHEFGTLKNLDSFFAGGALDCHDSFF